MTNLVAAEWLKLRTTRLLACTLPVAVVRRLAAVTGMVIAPTASELQTADGVRRVLSVAGAGATALAVGVLDQRR